MPSPFESKLLRYKEGVQFMRGRKPRSLAPGYVAEVDNMDERTWNQLVQGFEDGNIYQTGTYGSVVAGRDNVSYMVLRLDGEVVALAQARIKRVPIFGIGIAYVYWGPLWRRANSQANVRNLRQAVRALRNEYVCKRNLTLRVYPDISADDTWGVKSILADEEFSLTSDKSPSRTILINLEPSLDDIWEGMSPHWKRELKVAKKNHLEVIEGSSEELFQTFIAMYKEMVSRKRFAEPNDIYQFMLIQKLLPEALKMRILLCQSETGCCAGAIYSLIGNRAVYLFGATSTAGLKSRGSYLLQWQIIEALKLKNASVYDLNGINPAKNSGTYKFKSELAGKHGRDLYFLGKFDAISGTLSYLLIQLGEALRTGSANLKQRIGRGTNREVKAKQTECSASQAL